MTHPTTLAFRGRKSQRHQGGLSLIESMIGITIGLLVVLVATGTMVVTRQGNATISESYKLASAGNTAMRLIATTLRQAGAAELDQAAVGAPVSFGDLTMRASNSSDQLVFGTDGGAGASDTLTVSYQHKDQAVTRDCLGNSPGAATPERIDNLFSVVQVELRCVGTRSNGTAIEAAQALVGDNAEPNTQIAVEEFQVFYWVINAAGQQRRVTAANVPANGGWPAVDAVEVCLQLRGTGTTYPTANFNNCRDASVANGGRLHQVFRGTYKIRNRV